VDVYKSPALDLVGWFTLGPKSGPQPHVIPLQQQLMSAYNEAAILLLFHPDNVYDPATSAGKLPLSIYETVWESSKDAAAMEVDDQTNQNQGKSLKFRELGYTVETGEAEMISVDFVARGGGNATAIDTSKAQALSKPESQAPAEPAKGKGKAKLVEKEEEEEEPKSEALVLTPEEEESRSQFAV
jgi:COP9 signalosome complex subunit 6